MELLFLSFTTLTSVGLRDGAGDARCGPGSNDLGVAFIGMLVSRVVGMTLWARREDTQDRAESSA